MIVIRSVLSIVFGVVGSWTAWLLLFPLVMLVSGLALAVPALTASWIAFPISLVMMTVAPIVGATLASIVAARFKVVHALIAANLALIVGRGLGDMYINPGTAGVVDMSYYLTPAFVILACITGALGGFVGRAIANSRAERDRG